MTAHGVVDTLEVVERVITNLFPSTPNLPAPVLGLEGTKEAPHSRLVPMVQPQAQPQRPGLPRPLDFWKEPRNSQADTRPGTRFNSDFVEYITHGSRGPVVGAT